MSSSEVEATMSHFDSLLDFDTPSGNGTAQSNKDLDPFGNSPSIEVKAGSDFDLLGELGFSGQGSLTTNGNSNGPSVNPLYELSMDQDMSDNLIMTDDMQVSQKSTKSANPLYDLENDSGSSEPSANPLYDFSQNGAADTNGHSVDLLGMGTTDDSGVTMEPDNVNEGNNLLGSQDLKFEVRRDESHESMNGISDEDSSLVENLTEGESRAILEKNESLNQESKPEQVEITFDDQNLMQNNQTSGAEGNKTEVEDQSIETREETVESVDQTGPEEQNRDQDQEVIEEAQDDEQQDVITQEVVEEVLTQPDNIQQEVEEVQIQTEIVEQEVEDQTQPEVEADVRVEQQEQDYTEQETETQESVADTPTEEENREIAIDTVDYAEQQEVTPPEGYNASEEQKQTEDFRTVTETTQDTAVVQNGLDEENQEPSFDQMSSIKNKLESNQGDDEEIYRERKKSVHEEIADAEGGEYENEPVRNPDVIRESDKDIGAELPEVGTAKNILEKFKQIQTTPKEYKKERTPPEARKADKVEYVTEPTAHLEVEPQKIEGGIFENQPLQEEGVVHSYDAVEEALPEKGYAKNILERFNQISSTSPSSTPDKRELTPDRNTKYEYVSEPRSVMEKYEGKVESGVFESQPKSELPDIIRSGMSNEEVMPEKGTARNLASRYKEISEKSASAQVSERKRELTPDKSGKVEYVSEPRSTLEKYEGKSEAGVFESQPKGQEEIVRSNEQLEDILPEKGLARNIAAKFREIESSKSPSPTPTKPRFKEVTPPRNDIEGRTNVGVLESTPTDRGDIVKGSDGMELNVEEMPQRGMAKNLADKFKQYGQQTPSPTRGKKEFTPPPEGGVFENTPQPRLEVEVRQAESGILESTPSKREDVAREDTYSAGDVEFPEEGYAKNMVSKWKQMESKSTTSTPSPGKHREFTPPRDYPMSPKSPAGNNTSVQPSDLPGQYQEQKGYGGVYENKPQHLIGVAREGESDNTEELPEKDAAKSMVEKFKAIQEQAKKVEEKPKPKSRKDSGDSDTPVSANKKMFEGNAESPKGFVPVQLEKCAACQKTVYAMEKMEMNKHIYHRACFKCSHCKCVLTPKTFSMNEGVAFCTNHFKQLFARKGNYDEGFGRQQYKKKWGANGEAENEEQ